LIPLHARLKINSMRAVIMNFFGKDACWAAVVRWLAGASTLLYVFSRFIPGTPVDQYLFNGDIDNAWTQVLHAALHRHWQFGRDIVFTYGPWGFLSRGYDPATYPVAVAAWLLLSLVFWRAGWRLARHLSDRRLFSWFWLIGFAGLASIPVGDDLNVRLAAWVLLLLFLHFFVEEGAFTPTQALLVVSLGWLSLVKFTGFMETAMVVAVIAADNVFRHRRFPWIVPLWAASLLGFWVMAGQHLSSFGPYLCNSWRITSGYTEAMMLTVETEAGDVGCFLLLAVLLCVLTGQAAWARHRFFGVLPLAGLGAILFIIFKQGYVRHSRYEMSAAMVLLLASWMFPAMAWPKNRRSAGLALLLLVGSGLMTSSLFSRWLFGEGLLTQLGGTFSCRSLAAPVYGVFTGCLREDYENNIKHMRHACLLPPMPGGADLYSYYQTVLFIRGLPYQPRPVIQSYSAYTPELAGLNAAHLRTDRAAGNLLFAIQRIDNRFPSLDDGLSWPELLTRYDVKGAAEALGRTYLILSRSAAPREYHLTPLGDTSVRWGEPGVPPSVTNGPIWVEIEIKKTFIGTVVSTLYKPPVLELTVSLRDHGQQDFRLVPAMARGGFLLSPVIGNTRAFSELAGTNGPCDLAGREVMSMTLSADTRSRSTVCYQSPMRIRFYRLDFPRQDFKIDWPANPAEP
jgi:hypothetical protein